MIDDSMITYDEIIETTKTIMTKLVPAKRFPTNLNEKKVICKMKNFCIIVAFSLITMTLITLILLNVIILIKSVLNKDKNHYYYNIFLEKCSYK